MFLYKMGSELNPNNNGSSSLDRQNVSFKFTKTTSKKLTGNRLDENFSDTKTEKDFVISVAKSGIKSTAPKDKEKDLVIPLIRKNDWRFPDASVKDSTQTQSTIEELAIKELLKETSEKNEQWEKREFKNYTVTIPLIMQNKIPEGFETDEKMDVSLRPEESKLEDYEKVPVEQYGMAILRGMGWKEGDPIGANSKTCVEPVKVELRPKGLGLGANTSALKKAQEKKKDEKLELVKNSYVQIIEGPNKGFFGQVLGLDEENARAIVKLSGSEKVLTFPEFYINVISKKEFEKESRVINRSSYEKYKTERENKEKQDLKSKERLVESKDGHACEQKDERRRNPDSKSLKHTHSDETSKSTRKRRHSEERSSQYKTSDNKHKSVKSWVRPQLKVRLIDDKYKKGKYFNQKLIVVDVLSSRNCTCKTEDGRYLDDLSPSMLETVIPRTEPGYVMIVHGKYSGELCTILKKDKSKCLATVQFLSNRDQALKIEYDSICEYVGDISEFD